MDSEKLVSATYGAMLWLGAALGINVASTNLFSTKSPMWYQAPINVVSVPVTWLSVKGVGLFSSEGNIIRNSHIALATALLLDGTAIVAFPKLYGEDEGMRRGSAWLLFGVGLTLMWIANEKQ
jgi:hypothetical protein